MSLVREAGNWPQANVIRNVRKGSSSPISVARSATTTVALAKAKVRWSALPARLIQCWKADYAWSVWARNTTILSPSCAKAAILTAEDAPAPASSAAPRARHRCTWIN